MRNGLAVSGFLLVFLPSSGVGQASPDARTAVQNVVRTYVEAHNKADATAMMDLMSRRAEVSSVSDGEITRGWEAIRAETDKIVGREGQFRVAVGSMDVTTLGPNHALVVAPTTITVATPEGSVQVRGAMTLVLERSQGNWRVLNEHFSTRAAEDS